MFCFITLPEKLQAVKNYQGPPMRQNLERRWIIPASLDFKIWIINDICWFSYYMPGIECMSNMIIII